VDVLFIVIVAMLVVVVKPPALGVLGRLPAAFAAAPPV
jgi:hypothetical protein